MGNVTAHEADCPHRPIKCPFSVTEHKICDWEGHLTKIENHIKRTHTGRSDTLSVSGRHTKAMKITGRPSVWVQAIFTLGETFFLYSELKDNNMYFCILYVGHTHNASNYRYRVTVKKPDMSGVASSCHVTCWYLRNVEEIFREYECAVFQYQFVKKCLNEDADLLIEFVIFKRDDV